MSPRPVLTLVSVLLLASAAGPAGAQAPTSTVEPPAVSVVEPLKPGGTSIPRGAGQLNVRIEEGEYRVYFLDAAGVPGPLGFTAARLDWQQVGRPDNEGKLVLRPAPDGTHLVGGPVRKPWNHRVRIFVIEGNKQVEVIGPLVVRNL